MKKNYNFLATLILLFFISSCDGRDGEDGKAFLTLDWTTISADSVFIDVNSEFPDGDDTAHILKNGRKVCSVKVYNGDFGRIKGQSHEVDDGIICYGTIINGVVIFKTIHTYAEEGEPGALFWPGEDGENGNDYNYMVHLDPYNVVY